MPKSKGQEFTNRSNGQQHRRIRETIADVQDTLAAVADNQQAIAHVLIGHEARHNESDARHDQQDRTNKMFAARLAALEARDRTART